ncbi:hypothetical protein [Paracoccus sp. Ld10]|uniref:hypothetical protein n=1 Tax=Paracoccus sp. Ld10 TaxID=649158 RepID=UPI00386619BF
MERTLRCLSTALMIGVCGMGPQGVAAQQPPPVGDVPEPDQIRRIANPGIVGLGPDLPGSVYAVVSGYLVRVHIDSGKILSVLRPLPDRP